ncbi:MAG: alpha/beta fold hydrolase [Candidatus Hermodarchaeota archaeon]
MPKIKVGSFNLFYEIYGDGPPLLMIIGLGANSNWWGTYFLRGLAEHFKVIAFDNRGTGRSGDPKLDYSIKSLADDTMALLNALEIDNAYVFGHSMGGYIAQELVLNYDRVKKLILCSTSCGGPQSVLANPNVLEIINTSRKGRVPEEVAADSLEVLYSPEFITSNPKLINIAIKIMATTPITEESYIRQLKAIESFDTSTRLKNLNISTLIVHGMNDVLVPPKNAHILAELIPNSRVIIFPQSAHAPFVEEPNSIQKAIIEFLL